MCVWIPTVSIRRKEQILRLHNFLLNHIFCFFNDLFLGQTSMNIFLIYCHRAFFLLRRCQVLSDLFAWNHKAKAARHCYSSQDMIKSICAEKWCFRNGFVVIFVSFCKLRIVRSPEIVFLCRNYERIGTKTNQFQSKIHKSWLFNRLQPKKYLKEFSVSLVKINQEMRWRVSSWWRNILNKH